MGFRKGKYKIMPRDASGSLLFYSDQPAGLYERYYVVFREDLLQITPRYGYC